MEPGCAAFTRQGQNRTAFVMVSPRRKLSRPALLLAFSKPQHLHQGTCREQNQRYAPQDCRGARHAHRPFVGAVSKISAKLNEILATTFALYLKTKNFHWHVSGPHFRDYHLLLDQHGDQIFAITDDIAERVRKIGGTTIRSIGQISKLQGIDDNDGNFVPPVEMLRELMNDNKALIAAMREAHEITDKGGESPRPACSRTGSTRPNVAPGSCSKRRHGDNWGH